MTVFISELVCYMPLTKILGNLLIASFYVRAKRERILIKTISSLYIYRNIQKKFEAIEFQGVFFGRKPLFHVIASQFKVAEAWVFEMNKS